MVDLCPRCKLLQCPLGLARTAKGVERVGRGLLKETPADKRGRGRPRHYPNKLRSHRGIRREAEAYRLVRLNGSRGITPFGNFKALRIYHNLECEPPAGSLRKCLARSREIEVAPY